jgi:hypothetical protein
MANLSAEQLVYMTIITAVITLIFNSIFHALKNRVDWFSDTKKFQRDFSFEQLKQLYIPSYAIVAQSEFLRIFWNFDDKPYEEVPFFELVNTKTKFSINSTTGYSKSEVDLSDVITEFNKIELVNMIINKGMFASQHLLKLAVAYRYVHKHYQNESLEAEKLNKFRIQEIDLIDKIVRLVVRETNEKLKQCSLIYSENEIDLSRMLVDYVKTDMKTD